ncbi:MAG: M48 family metallopeptidase [Saprospiraceae bacterium]|nr:M48 family metallopeptidase [Saprospiraceae bacterium]MBK7913973.1 M48 family metallopeptidase [Saprospiraceae bacterium]
MYDATTDYTHPVRFRNVMKNAFYYSGIKPSPVPVEVNFEPDSFKIIIQKNNQIQSVEWPINQIKPDSNYSGMKLILSHGVKPPFEYLEFDSTEILDFLQNKYPYHKWIKKDDWINKNAFGLILGGIAILVIGILGLYLLIAPKVSDGLTKTIPIKWEVELGDKMFSQFMTADKENKLKSMQLDSFFKLMNVTSAYPIRIHFSEDTILNAFAIPGGHIVVYKGLIDKLNNYESLAGLLAHEFTHIERKHSLKTIFRSASSYLILAAVFGDLTGLAGVILENANSIQNLSYSRKFEHEADQYAVSILLDRKIGLTGMLDLFKVFLNIGNKGLSVPAFLSTHPVTEDRIKYIESHMAGRESETMDHQELKQLFLRLKL